MILPPPPDDDPPAPAMLLAIAVCIGALAALLFLASRCSP
jgi:hypothetical protein